MQFAIAARNGQQKSERGTFYEGIKSESITFMLHYCAKTGLVGFSAFYCSNIKRAFRI